MISTKSKTFNRLIQVLGLSGALLMLWLTFRGLDLTQTWSIIERVGPAAIVVIIPFFVGMVLDSMAWKQMFRHLKRPMPLGQLLGVRLASEGVLLSVSGGPLLSEGLAPYLLHKRYRVPYSQAVATLAIRKAVMVVSQAVYIGLGAVLGFVFLRTTSIGVIGVPGLEWVMVLVSGILFVVSVVITASLTQGAAGAWLSRWLAKIRHRRLTPKIDALRTGLLATDRNLQRALGETPQDAFRLTATYFLTWIVEAFETFAILRLLGVEISFVEVWAFEPALSLLRHLVFFVPAGLGFQDVGYVAFLKAYGVADPLAVGSAFILLKRSKELLWAAFGLGLLYHFMRSARAPEATARPARPVEGPDIKRVLLICGSINQTKQMLAVGKRLRNCECWYSPYYGTGLAEFSRRVGLLETSIAGSKLVNRCKAWLEANGAKIDYGGRKHNYDFVITSSDQLVPGNVAGKPMVLVQEGMTDPVNFVFVLQKWFPYLVPRFLAGTAATGQSKMFRKFCVASEGYQDYFVSHGIDPDTIAVTGIPNFDNCIEYTNNDFPHRGFTLVCTSDGRETFKRDDRRAFVERAVNISGGGQMIFKLHPNEDHERAKREIEHWAPGALVYADGCAEEMVANCQKLVCEWSSLAFVGIALGKEVYSNFDLETLQARCPVQNGGRSADNIAQVCQALLDETPSVRETTPRIQERTTRRTGDPISEEFPL